MHISLIFVFRILSSKNQLRGPNLRALKTLFVRNETAVIRVHLVPGSPCVNCLYKYRIPYGILFLWDIQLTLDW